MKSIKESPSIVLKDGEPTAVILDINEYRELIERIEDVEDMEILEEMREKALSFRKLEDFLVEEKMNV